MSEQQHSRGTGSKKPNREWSTREERLITVRGFQRQQPIGRPPFFSMKMALFYGGISVRAVLFLSTVSPSLAPTQCRAAA